MTPSPHALGVLAVAAAACVALGALTSRVDTRPPQSLMVTVEVPRPHRLVPAAAPPLPRRASVPDPIGTARPDGSRAVPSAAPPGPAALISPLAAAFPALALLTLAALGLRRLLRPAAPDAPLRWVVCATATITADTGAAAPAKKRRPWTCARPTDAELTAKVTELLTKRDMHWANQEITETETIASELRALGINWDFSRRIWVARSVPWEQAAWDDHAADPELLGTITEALGRRDAFSAASDAEGAKAVSEELRAKGVRLDVTRRTWAVGSPGAAAPAGERRPWTPVRPTDAALTEKVTQLLDQRDAHIATKDSVRAEAIASELNAMGITWNRQRRLWVDRSLPWVQAPSDAEQADPELVATVTEALERRDALYAGNDKNGAKAIADELLAKGVRLINTRRTWTTAPTYSTTVEPVSGLMRWVCVRPTDAALTRKVTAMLGRRDVHQRNREYEQADAIQRELEEMGIRVNDRRRIWVDRAVPWEQAARDPQKVGPDFIAKVTEALRRRDALIAAKDNDGAKAVMEELLQEGVRLDNSRRKWTTVPARPTDDDPSSEE